MKKIILVLILISFSCNTKKSLLHSSKSRTELGIITTAQVFKIDSIANYYLVYIKGDKGYFKIISKKNEVRFYNSIKVEKGKKYKFLIQETPNKVKEPFPIISYLKFSRCEKFDKTEICNESSFELALASNLKGLYISK